MRVVKNFVVQSMTFGASRGLQMSRMEHETVKLSGESFPVDYPGMFFRGRRSGTVYKGAFPFGTIDLFMTPDRYTFGSDSLRRCELALQSLNENAGEWAQYYKPFFSFWEHHEVEATAPEGFYEAQTSPYQYSLLLRPCAELDVYRRTKDYGFVSVPGSDSVETAYTLMSPLVLAKSIAIFNAKHHLLMPARRTPRIDPYVLYTESYADVIEPLQAELIEQSAGSLESLKSIVAERFD